MPGRLRVRKCRRDGRNVFVLEGEVDGSTACHALDVLGRATPDALELVLDLSALTDVDPFGLEVLSRGLRKLAHARRLRIQASSPLLPVLNSIVEGLLVERAT